MDEEMVKPKPATVSSKGIPLFGILNAYGDFWTPLPFESEAKARQHIIDFWGTNTESRDKCLRTHKIVPVRVRLTALRTSKENGRG